MPKNGVTLKERERGTGIGAGVHEAVTSLLCYIYYGAHLCHLCASRAHSPPTPPDPSYFLTSPCSEMFSLCLHPPPSPTPHAKIYLAFSDTTPLDFFLLPHHLPNAYSHSRLSTLMHPDLRIMSPHYWFSLSLFCRALTYQPFPHLPQFVPIPLGVRERVRGKEFPFAIDDTCTQHSHMCTPSVLLSHSLLVVYTCIRGSPSPRLWCFSVL